MLICVAYFYYRGRCDCLSGPGPALYFVPLSTFRRRMQSKNEELLERIGSALDAKINAVIRGLRSSEVDREAEEQIRRLRSLWRAFRKSPSGHSISQLQGDLSCCMWCLCSRGWWHCFEIRDLHEIMVLCNLCVSGLTTENYGHDTCCRKEHRIQAEKHRQSEKGDPNRLPSPRQRACDEWKHTNAEWPQKCYQ